MADLHTDDDATVDLLDLISICEQKVSTLSQEIHDLRNQLPQSVDEFCILHQPFIPDQNKMAEFRRQIQTLALDAISEEYPQKLEELSFAGELMNESMPCVPEVKVGEEFWVFFLKCNLYQVDIWEKIKLLEKAKEVERMLKDTNETRQKCREEERASMIRKEISEFWRNKVEGGHTSAANAYRGFMDALRDASSDG